MVIMAYKVKVKYEENADKFRQPAVCFQTNGYYTAIPRGTTEYRKFWDEEYRRCLFGHTAEDGDYITGYFYFYLNYCPILLTIKEKTKMSNGQYRESIRRIRDFPRFYDYDRAYFDAIDEAERTGKHLVVIKKRGAGYSFKAASMLCRNFFLIPDSKSYAIASENEFLIKDGVLTKAWDIMDWINEHTPWSKKCQKIDQKMHKRASIVINKDGVQTEIGYKSEVIGISLKNDPQKARGKRGKLIIWEEAGKFPNLKAAWQIARPSVEDSGVAFGLMIAYGTGGSDDADYTGLKDLYYEPKAYNALAISNDWDEENYGGECGFFVPEYYNVTDVYNGDDPDYIGQPFMDQNGNSNIFLSKKYAVEERKKIVDNASDRTAIDRYICEHPFTPAEATLNIKGNIFPKADLIRHLANIRNSKKLQNFKQVGELVSEIDGVLKWEIKSSLKALNKYRLEVGEDKHGAITIWEHPVDNPPYGLYIAGCLLPGEKVLTDKGLVNVEEVTLKDSLVNRDGSIVEISNLQRYQKDNEDVYKLRSFGSFRSTTFTKEHPILTNKGFVKAENIVIGDTLIIPNRYNKETIDWKLKLQFYLGEDFVNYNNQVFWWFLGLWLGDGFNNKNHNSNDIYVAFGKNQMEESNQYDRIIKELFNRSTVLCKANGGQTRRFTYKNLFNLLNEEFGKLAISKKIPEWVKYAPSQLKHSFILGYLDSDGSSFLDRDNIRVNFTSINLELLESIQDILYSIGICSSITLHNKSKVSIFNNKSYISKESYRLSVLARDVKVIIPKFYIDINSRKINLINQYNKSERRQTGEQAVVSSCGNYIFLKVVENEHSKYTGIVYNFECDTHTYMTRNIVTHNCDPLNSAVWFLTIRIG